MVLNPHHLLPCGIKRSALNKGIVTDWLGNDTVMWQMQVFMHVIFLSIGLWTALGTFVWVLKAFSTRSRTFENLSIECGAKEHRRNMTSPVRVLVAVTLHLRPTQG